MASQRQLPHQRWPRPYLYQIPALEGLCDDGRNRRTDSSKHHQVVRPIFYCIVEGFQPFCIITLGSNTQKEKPKLETAFPRDKGPMVHSHKQSSLMGNLGVRSPVVRPRFKPVLSPYCEHSEVWSQYPSSCFSSLQAPSKSRTSGSELSSFRPH